MDDRLELIHARGDVGHFLKISSGDAGLNVIDLTVDGLRPILRASLYKVAREQTGVINQNIRLPHQSGDSTFVDLHVRPVFLDDALKCFFLVSFIERPIPDVVMPVISETPSDARDQRIVELERELAAIHERLQVTAEELEGANEELQSLNEELHSANEELQSTNEELYTVNNEYQNKIIELTELNNDVDNLLTSSQVGKLLLDENMEIRRFSTFIKTIFKVLESDIGRPLTHLTHHLVDEDPVKDVKTVMQTRRTIEKDVQTGDGKWYFMRILPYQIGPDSYSGTVLSFMDITELKKSRDALEKKNRELLDAQALSRIGNWELDLTTNTLIWSQTIFDIFEVDAEAFEATYEAFLERVHPDDRQRLDQLYRWSVENREPYNTTHRLLFDDGRIKYVHEICRTEYDENGKPLRSIGVVQEVTRQKLLEDRLQASEDRYRSLFDTIHCGVAVYKAVDNGSDFEFVDVNKAAERIENVSRKDLLGKRISEAFPGVGHFGLLETLKRVWQSGRSETHPAAFYQDDRISGWRENQVYRLPNGDVVAVYDEMRAESREAAN